MITLVRIEADGKTPAELIADLDRAEKGLKLPKDYHVHDEHYERVHDECFKGRRVFKPGIKSPGASAYVVPRTATAATGAVTYSSGIGAPPDFGRSSA